MVSKSLPIPFVSTSNNDATCITSSLLIRWKTSTAAWLFTSLWRSSRALKKALISADSNQFTINFMLTGSHHFFHTYYHFRTYRYLKLIESISFDLLFLLQLRSDCSILADVNHMFSRTLLCLPLPSPQNLLNRSLRNFSCSPALVQP